MPLLSVSQEESDSVIRMESISMSWPLKIIIVKAQGALEPTNRYTSEESVGSVKSLTIGTPPVATSQDSGLTIFLILAFASVGARKAILAVITNASKRQDICLIKFFINSPFRKSMFFCIFFCG